MLRVSRPSLPSSRAAQKRNCSGGSTLIRTNNLPRDFLPPEVVRVPFEGADGRRATEVIYYLQQDLERFRVGVFDVLRAGINEPTAIARAAAAMPEFP